MARNYHLTQTGPEVQELLNKIKLATHEEPGLMSAEDKAALDRLSEDALSKAVNITYADLVALRTAGELAPGQFYRVTDYVTTTADAESRSAGHQFDLVVMAIDGSHLSEEAFAAHHEGDSYFANSALDAWRVWYCLDNDSTRFAWADTVNGKGVIYRMIDEYDNDVPYDFKNIQFKRYEILSSTHTFLSPLIGLFIGRTGYIGITIDSSSYRWYYTFSKLGNAWDATVEDASLGGYTTKVVFAMKQLTNTIANTPRLLNNVFMYGPVAFDFLHTQAGDSGSYSPLTYFTGWRIDGCDCSKNTLVGWFGLNQSESTFRNNLIVAGFRHSCTGTNFESNVIFVPHDFSHCTIGQDFENNIIKIREISAVSFDNAWSHNVLNGDNSGSDTIKQASFGTVFYGNTLADVKRIVNGDFGNYVANNTFTGIDFGSVRINGQITYCTFTGKFTSCSVEPICGYADFVGGTNGSTCVGLDVVGSIRGASSSRITISSPNFILPNASGTNRRVRLEGCTDGSLVATWKGADGKIVGIRSADNGATWNNYEIVSSDAVKYTSQSLTDLQKLTARRNVDAQGLITNPLYRAYAREGDIYYNEGTWTAITPSYVDFSEPDPMGSGQTNFYRTYDVSQYTVGTRVEVTNTGTSQVGWALLDSYIDNKGDKHYLSHQYNTETVPSGTKYVTVVAQGYSEYGPEVEGHPSATFKQQPAPASQVLMNGTWYYPLTDVRYDGTSIVTNGVASVPVIVRANTTAHWDSATGYIPAAGEIIIYTDYKTETVDGQTVDVPGIKIGSGNGYIQDLAFVGDADAKEMLAHIQNTRAHVSSEDRAFWDNKINVDDQEEVVNETLIFNRN